LNIKLATSILIFICTVAISAPKGKITVQLSEFQKLKGKIYIGLFDSSNYFKLGHIKSAFKHKIELVIDKNATFVFDSVPSGHYAIALFHDINSNGKFEYWNEDFGFSNGGTIIYKSPIFSKSKFYFDGTSKEVDVGIENERNQRPESSNKVAYAPVVSYAPETKLQLGVSLLSLFKLKKSDTLSRTSYLDMFALITQNYQGVLKQNYLFFTNREKYVITGLTWFQYFPQFYFGRTGDVLHYGNRELVKYYQFKIDVLIQRRVFKKIFLGVGYRNSTIFGLSSPDNGNLYNSNIPGKTGYYTSGLQVAITSDTRDNIYYPTDGHYLRLKSTFHLKQIGSEYVFHIHEVDLRKYFKLSKRRWDVLAFNFYGYFSGGKVPWNELGAMGNDQIMRGYYSGQFRDYNYMAIQAEYRFPINRIFGLAAFVGTGEVATRLIDFTLHELKPNGGIGARYKIDRKDRLNLRFDAGIGTQGFNFYLSASEAF
jgi:uncharacterized protein (DUF2141 family)